MLNLCGKVSASVLGCSPTQFPTCCTMCYSPPSFCVCYRQLYTGAVCGACAVVLSQMLPSSSSDVSERVLAFRLRSSLMHLLVVLVGWLVDTLPMVRRRFAELIFATAAAAGVVLNTVVLDTG